MERDAPSGAVLVMRAGSRATTLGGIAFLACATSTALAACGSSSDGSDAPRDVGLVVEIDSEMSPAAIDHLGIEAFDATAKSIYRNLVPLAGAGAIPLPLAFELQAPSDPRITLHVFGLLGGQIRVMREVIVRIPPDHAKYLPIKLEWICTGQANGTFTDAETNYQNNCGDTKTCRAGTCAPSAMDSEQLPDQSPSNDACMDTGCFATAMKVTPDADCTVPLPPGDGMVNVGMITTGDGPCGSATCTVPLDHDKDNGWIESGANAQLPKGVCDALTSLKITSLVVARCPTQKTPTTPTCPSNSDAGAPLPVADDAATDAAPTDAAPQPG